MRSTHHSARLLLLLINIGNNCWCARFITAQCLLIYNIMCLPCHARRHCTSKTACTAARPSFTVATVYIHVYHCDMSSGHYSHHRHLFAAAQILAAAQAATVYHIDSTSVSRNAADVHDDNMHKKTWVSHHQLRFHPSGPAIKRLYSRHIYGDQL